MKLFDLTGRIALITGSSQGIGLALAQALGAAGARVVLNARNAGKLEQACAALRAQGVVDDAAAARNHLVICVDVSEKIAGE